ncbi:MAG: TIGR04222 domain-containing membrane protein [Verrucomicrobiales bacterium]
MKKEKPELLHRIESYSPDDPGATFPYSARLARDNRWPTIYAQRVLREYKRFAYLAMVAGHPVTPSDQVDQAWHLHMIYTKSYWDEFCKGILGSPLHHSPTKGGGTEQGKFIDWYAKTLESYREHFGEEAPVDIWPAAAQRFGQDIRFLRVNTERNWVFRKPAWWCWLASLRPSLDRLRLARPAGLTLLAPALLLALAGCTQLVGATAIAPGISGPAFLWLFVILGIAGLIVAAVKRSSLRDTGSRPPTEIEGYPLAYLNGGSSRLVDAIVVNLVRERYLLFDKNKALLSRSELPASVLDPLEQSVYELIPTAPSSIRVADLRRGIRPHFTPAREALRDARLLLTPAQSNRASLWPLLIAITVPLVGILRILYGNDQGEAVGILIILTIVFGAIALCAFVPRARRSRAGDQLVRWMKKQNRKLRTHPTGEALPIAVGLYGVGCLDGTAYADLAPTLTPKSGHTGCGGGCGGGDGGSGGGGDGCGGGGCGGCGGCG